MNEPQNLLAALIGGDPVKKKRETVAASVAVRRVRERAKQIVGERGLPGHLETVVEACGRDMAYALMKRVRKLQKWGAAHAPECDGVTCTCRDFQRDLALAVFDQAKAKFEVAREQVKVQDAARDRAADVDGTDAFKAGFETAALGDFGGGRDACPYPATDDRRPDWLAGYAAAERGL